MKTLENWIEKFIEQPINFKKKIDVEAHLRKELDALALSTNGGNSVESSRVYNEILRLLHLEIRGHAQEDAIWNALLWYLSHPLPTSLAHDLIDRGVAIIAMCHTNQQEEVLWRLATIDEDALYTLVRKRYMERQFSPEQFAMMLDIYVPRDDGLLTMLLSFWTESAEKEAIFVAAIERKLEWISEQKKQRHKRGAAYFKEMLAIRPDIIERLSKKHRRLI